MRLEDLSGTGPFERPTVAPRIPYDLERLPDAGELNLELPVYDRTSPGPVRFAVAEAAAVTAAAFVARLWFQQTDSSLALFAMLGVPALMAALTLLLRRTSTAAALSWLFVPLVALWSPRFGSLSLYAVALLLVAYLARAFVLHTAALRASSPSVDEPRRLAFRDALGSLSFGEVLAAAWNPSPDDASPGARDAHQLKQRLAFGVLALAAALALGSLASSYLHLAPVLEAAAALLASAVVLSLWAVFACWRSDSTLSSNLNFWLATAEKPQQPSFADHLHFWWAYNWTGIPVPGVAKSPAGAKRSRFFLTRGSYIAFAVALVVSASYFPLALLQESDPAVWAPEHHANAYKAVDIPPAVVADAEARLDWGAQQRYFEQWRRDEYARQVLARSDALFAYPEGWLSSSMFPLHNGRPWLLLWLAASLLACLLVPVVLFHVALAAAAAPSLRLLDRLFASDESKQPSKARAWSVAAKRLRESPNALEREHLWLGELHPSGQPALLHRELVETHAHILGGTGSGKTSRGIAPMLEQLVGPEDSLVVVDLKGDMALFQATRVLARRVYGAGRFRWLTTEAGKSTFAFNPFAQSHIAGLPALERTELYTKPLGLEYGEGYGPSFFSRQNRAALLKLLKARPEARSARELAFAANQTKGSDKLFTKREREAASDLFATLDSLAEIEALNVTTDAPIDLATGQPMADPFEGTRREDVCAAAIDMADVLDTPQALYVNLPGTLQTTTLREVGKFALHSLVTAAAMRGERERRRVWLVVDEFQLLVSEHISTFLEQARSMRIGLILVNQTVSQLERASKTMVHDLEANTSVKLVFSANDIPQRRALSELSGESIYMLESAGAYEWGVGMDGESELVANWSAHEAIGPRFRAGDLIEFSANNELVYVHAKRNSGYTLFGGYPVIVRMEHYIPKSKYVARLEKPWPAETAATLTAPLLRTAVVEPQAPPSAAPATEPSTEPEAPTSGKYDDVVRRLTEGGS